MIKYIKIILVLLFLTSCNNSSPNQFSEPALNDVFETLNGDHVTLKEILDAKRGQPILIDIWASWCGDCIKGMPKLKALQEEYKDVAYVFLSLDRSQEAWIKGINKYDIQGEHYFMPSAKESPFGDFVNIDWIPRYMVVGPEGKIKLFKAVEADDKEIKKSLTN